MLWLRSPLPKGIYDELETSEPSSSTQGFKGSLGMIQIVRYSDTPVGSYDELLIIPGTFETPGGSQKGKPRLRITRIYVSGRDTCYNGRVNWNIPKHLARFEFSSPPTVKGQSPPSALDISVYPPSSFDNAHPTTPFFKAKLTPSRYLPSVPLSTSWLPLSTILVQPPLPAGDDLLLAGTDRWCTFAITAKTRKARLMAVRVDDVDEPSSSWPDVKPWSLGIWLEEATLDIPTPEEFVL